MSLWQNHPKTTEINVGKPVNNYHIFIQRFKYTFTLLFRLTDKQSHNALRSTALPNVRKHNALLQPVPEDSLGFYSKEKNWAWHKAWHYSLQDSFMTTTVIAPTVVCHDQIIIITGCTHRGNALGRKIQYKCMLNISNVPPLPTPYSFLTKALWDNLWF